MDGWMDGRTDGWMDASGWINRWIDGWMDACMHAWVCRIQLAELFVFLLS